MDVPITESPSSVELNGENSLRRLRIVGQLDERVGYDTQSWVATTQQAAVADALTATGTMWNGALSSVTTKGHCHPEDQLDAIHSITQDYYQPYTIVACHPDVINGVDDQRETCRISITSGIFSVNAECERIQRLDSCRPSYEPI